MTVTQIEKRQLVQPLDYVAEDKLTFKIATGGVLIEKKINGHRPQILHLTNTEFKQIVEQWNAC